MRFTANKQILEHLRELLEGRDPALHLERIVTILENVERVRWIIREPRAPN